MPRKEPALKLERSPLAFVLSQVRFPAVLKMEDRVPDIQEALRKQDFPRYNKEDIQQVTFSGNELKAERDKRWVFVSRSRHEAVILSSNFVVYETSDYDVFETFTERFSPVLKLIADATTTEFVEQLGLRYVDLIRPTENKAACEFLRENVRGLSQEDLGASSLRNQFSTQAHTEQGDLFVRSFENTGPNMVPPDLVSTHLRFKTNPDDLKDELYRILDIDHISKGEFDFHPEDLIQKLWDLHEFSSKAFEAAVTEEAIEFWKREA
ncbi:MAG TPA: TIGR04255 family protein [Gammaproteobacteria bacterium]|nr:TIGR04255 family protein [Gammaproteobacteria bacterium]